MYVTLHGRQQHLALRAALGLLGFQVRREVGHRLFHHAGGFDHLRQEHFARAEEVAHHVHAVHQRAFDDFQRAAQFAVGFLGIGFHEIGNARDKRVRQPLTHGQLAPGVLGRHLALHVLVPFREGQQPLGGVLPTGQNHVLHRLAQFGFDVVVHGQHPRVHDAHVQPGADGVVEKDRVHRLAHVVVAPEAERHVGNPARHQRPWQVLFDPARRLDEVQRVAVMLLDAGRHRQHVRVKDDVLRRKIGLLGQQFVGARGNFLAAFQIVGLPPLVEGHDHRRRPVAPQQPGAFQELVLAVLQRNGVDNRLALHAPEARFQNLPLGRIQHQRHAGNVGFARQQVQELDHRRLTVQHSLVEVDVHDLRAVIHLLARNFQARIKIARQNRLAEFGAAGHVGALAHVHEIGFGRQGEGFETAEAQEGREFGRGARLDVPDGLGNGPDVLGRGAAAAAHDVD